MRTITTVSQFLACRHVIPHGYAGVDATWSGICCLAGLYLLNQIIGLYQRLCRISTPRLAHKLKFGGMPLVVDFAQHYRFHYSVRVARIAPPGILLPTVVGSGGWKFSTSSSGSSLPRYFRRAQYDFHFSMCFFKW
jgi:hypothetical protein